MVQRVNDADESRDPFYEIVGETWPRERAEVIAASTTRPRLGGVGIATLEDVLEDILLLYIIIIYY